MQAGAKAGLNTIAQFRVEPDHEERVIKVPSELEVALAEDRALRRWFDKLGYSMRKYLSDSVTEVKSPEARRAGQVAERLLAAMEAVRELPPMLRVAFANDPLAWEGWKRMSSTQRRTVARAGRRASAAADEDESRNLPCQGIIGESHRSIGGSSRAPGGPTRRAALSGHGSRT